MAERDEGGNEFRRVRLEKLEAMERMGIDPFPYRFAPSTHAADLDQRYRDLAPGTLTSDRVAVAGRIRAIRNSGMFIDLHDATGKIQVFSHKDHLSEERLALVRLLDLGDLIGVEGVVRR